MSTTADATTERDRILDDLGLTHAECVTSAHHVDAIIDAAERADQTVPWPMSTTVGGHTVHRYQRVDEEPSNPLADEPVQWIVQHWTDEDVLLAVPGPWETDRVPRDVFAERVADGTYTLLTTPSAHATGERSDSSDEQSDRMDGEPIRGY